MYQPEAYGITLAFMLGSMLCWGSWANTMKLTRGWPFQAFYWDYVVGVVLATLVWGFTLGSYGTSGFSFLADLRNADRAHLLSALGGGIVFNVANLLLVAAIDLAGLAVAFPIGIGLALVVGVVLNYIVEPRGNPVLLFLGVALVLLAIVVDALAYRRREVDRAKTSKRGIQLSLVCGVLMGSFYPLVARGTQGAGGLGPYAVAFVFSLGVLGCSLPVNAFLMRHPLTDSAPVEFGDYAKAPLKWHVWAVFGGAIWASGAVLNFVASHAAIVGPAVSYAIGQGATMVSAFWGVFVWREFASAPPASRRLIPLMFLFFLVGLAVVAVAPIVGHVGQGR